MRNSKESIGRPSSWSSWPKTQKTNSSTASLKPHKKSSSIKRTSTTTMWRFSGWKLNSQPMAGSDNIKDRQIKYLISKLPRPNFLYSILGSASIQSVLGFGLFSLLWSTTAVRLNLFLCWGSTCVFLDCGCFLRGFATFCLISKLWCVVCWLFVHCWTWIRCKIGSWP